MISHPWFAPCVQADLYLDGVATSSAGLSSGVESTGIVTGSGILAGSSNPAQPWSNDGAVVGLSLSEPITITGFAGGGGSYDNVEFAGTISPGHSPALVTVGSVIYTSSNTLIMELGGLLPGSQHDKVVHNGLSLAGGTLQVTLINAFVPTLGNVFDIFDWNAGVVGTFATVNLPALNPGLAWDATDLYLGGTLSVVSNVPEASASLFGGLAAALTGVTTIVRGRRRSLSS